MSSEPLPHRLKIIRIWLLIAAGFVVLTLLVGGATRLTESGLSIVEWRPVTGALPPLNEAQWQAEFQKYQTIPQYRELNRGMTLYEFKTIYWWEWAHRFLGRLIGAVFLLPFLFFLWRGWIPKPFRPRLWVIFGLGLVQGGVGWWMVASGLSERVSVSQYRLAFHLTLACVIYAALLWMAFGLQSWPGPSRPFTSRHSAQKDVDARLKAGHDGVIRRLRLSAGIVLGLVVLQIYLGALVAGLDAGLSYNTWPLIDGAFIPDAGRLLFEQPLWRNAFENALTVQFNHRMLAYLLALAVLLHVADCLRRRAGANTALALIVMTILQIGVGILTLVHQVPIALGILHQGMAVVLLTVAVLHAQALAPRFRGRTAAEPFTTRSGAVPWRG